jgi:hypothetical protein
MPNRSRSWPKRVAKKRLLHGHEHLTIIRERGEDALGVCIGLDAKG